MITSECNVYKIPSPIPNLAIYPLKSRIHILSIWICL